MANHDKPQHGFQNHSLHDNTIKSCSYVDASSNQKGKLQALKSKQQSLKLKLNDCSINSCDAANANLTYNSEQGDNVCGEGMRNPLLKPHFAYQEDNNFPANQKSIQQSSLGCTKGCSQSFNLKDHKQDQLSSDIKSRESSIVSKSLKKGSDENKLRKAVSIIDCRKSRAEIEVVLNEPGLSRHNRHTNLDFNGIPQMLSTVDNDRAPYSLVTIDNNENPIWHSSPDKRMTICTSVFQPRDFKSTCEKSKTVTIKNNKEHFLLATTRLVEVPDTSRKSESEEIVKETVYTGSQIDSDLPKSKKGVRYKHSGSNLTEHSNTEETLAREHQLQKLQISGCNKCSFSEGISLEGDENSESNCVKTKGSVTSLDPCHKSFCHTQQNLNKPSERRHIFKKSKLPLSIFYNNFSKPVILRKNKSQSDKSHHHSAVDLHRKDKNESSVTEHKPFSLGVNHNALSRSHVQLYKEAKPIVSRLKSAESVLVPDRKRLCKSLSNITAEDLLSVPCSSIYDRKDISHPARVPSSANLTDSNIPRITSSTSADASIKARLSNAMPKYLKESQDRKNTANGKLASRNSKADMFKGGISENDSAHKTKATTKSLTSRQNEVIEHKPTRKAPKLPKSLFPFIRKSKKSPNQSSNGQTKPLKAQDKEESVLKDNALLASTNQRPNSILREGNSIKLVSDKEKDMKLQTESFGFKKLEVPSKPVTRNVHADYATRVARMQQISRGQQDSSSTSSPSSNASHDHEGTKKVVSAEVEVVLRKKTRHPLHESRYSADFYSSSENVAIRPRRPSSLVTSTGDPTWRYSSGPKRASKISNTDLGDEHTRDRGNSETEQMVQRQPLSPKPFKKDSILVPQSENETSTIQQPSEDRCTSNSENVCNSTSNELLDTIPSFEPKVGRHKSGSSPNVLCRFQHSSSTNNFLQVADANRTSSLNSLFESDRNQTKSKVQWSSDTKDSDESTFTSSKSNHKNSGVVRRSKSLCRDKPFGKGNFRVNQRPVSPLFAENSVTHDNFFEKPPFLSHRNQSLKDFSSYERPIKPTTPKPRKMSSSSSTSSLNKANFQLSLGIIPGLDQQSSGFARQSSNQEISSEASGEVRYRSSAKNSQIRRRMSLQVCNSPTTEIAEVDSLFSMQLLKEFEERKRHSIAGLDTEKVKAVVARWSIAAPSGSANNVRRTRRRKRPLSEVPNLRMEVHAIPEHREVTHNLQTEDTTKSPANDGLTSPPNGSNPYYIKPHVEAVQRIITPRLLHNDAREAFRLGMLGTCFSEEDISGFRGEEFSNDHPLPRSLSIIGGLNAMPESLLKFYPTKYYGENVRLSSNPSNHMMTSLSTFGDVMYEKSLVQGSTVSGLSNESGYGTMTRKNAHLRPNDGEEEDVFTHNHSSRLSNGDFPNEDGLYVEALWDHVTMDDDELGFKVGEVIRVIDMSNADWWWGELDSYEGWFPATFVRILVNQHREEAENNDVISMHNDDDTHEYARVTGFGDDHCQCTEKVSTSSVHCAQCGLPLRGMDSFSANRDSAELSGQRPQIIVSPPSQTTKNSSTNRDHVRKNVINEIVNSEKVFAGHLKDVIEGYLFRCRQRSDMFTEDQIKILFGNIEEIYEFQQKFAAELEAALNKTNISDTELGNIFLDYKFGFAIYSEYCNNHPQALAFLSQVLVMKKYIHFFEACRLLQRMIDIPLDGFLLTPVQKICKYPLQLAELLKYTSPEHPDYKPVKSALSAMKDVARMINERKRKMENIRKISLWQASIVNWQGEDVLVRSNELVHSGEVYASSHSKNKPKLRTVFLFDHQLIVCKKDLLRKDLLYYKTRVDLDLCDVTPVEGYSPRNSMNLSGDWSSSGSGGVQCGWRITHKTTGDSSVMICKNEEDFEKWMRALPQEREIALSQHDDNIKEELIKDLLKTSLTAPRKPKDSGSFRAPPSYRYRSKLAQESNQSSKHKVMHSPSEKNSFFGKFASFRRTTVRETNYVY